MNTTPEDERVRTSISDHQFDIYDEDGNVRVDFLTGVREAVTTIARSSAACAAIAEINSKMLILSS